MARTSGRIATNRVARVRCNQRADSDLSEHQREYKVLVHARFEVVANVTLGVANASLARVAVPATVTGLVSCRSSIAATAVA